MSRQQAKFKESEIGPIPEEWEVLRVMDVSHVNEKVISNKDPIRSIEYLDTASVYNGAISSFQNLNLAEAPSRARRVLRDGDTIISTVRPSLKHFAFIKNAKKDWIGSTGFAVVSPKEIDPSFLYYRLTTDSVTEYLSSIAASQTSTFPAFNPEAIENMLIAVPSKIEQQYISSILSSLDDKIELNHQINANLEKIASALFKLWYVDFEFPDENGRPYKSSGGKMVESEMGEIPEGWRIGFLTDFVDIAKGVSYKGSDLKDDGESALVGLKCFARGGGFRADGIKRFAGDFKKQHQLDPGDLIVAMTDLTQGAEVLGKPALVPNIKNTKSVVASLDVSILRPKTLKITRAYLYTLFMRDETQGFLFGYSNGSTVLHLSIKGLNEFTLVVPPEHLLQIFNGALNPIFDQMQILNDEKQGLMQMRDSLLPRLMSGKIRVNV